MVRCIAFVPSEMHESLLLFEICTGWMDGSIYWIFCDPLMTFDDLVTPIETYVARMCLGSPHPVQISGVEQHAIMYQGP